MKKDLARQLARARALSGREAQPKPAPHPNDVRRPLDTWSPEMVREFRDVPSDEGPLPRPWGIKDRVPEIRKAEASPAPEEKTKPAEKALDKRRIKKVAVAVSEEEESILREYLKENDLSLSSWGRKVFFAAMGKKIPPRY